MCIICVELAKQAMTPSEARRALREMTENIGREHVVEVEAAIDAKLEEVDAAPRDP